MTEQNQTPQTGVECGGSKWSRCFSETTVGDFEEAFSLCSSCDGEPGEPSPTQPPQIRNDLWVVQKVFDYGPEENLRLWRHADATLAGLCKMAEEWDRDKSTVNEALIVALTDCQSRVKEEARRQEAELQMRREWAKQQPSSSEAWA